MMKIRCLGILRFRTVLSVMAILGLFTTASIGQHTHIEGMCSHGLQKELETYLTSKLSDKEKMKNLHQEIAHHEHYEDLTIEERNDLIKERLRVEFIHLHKETYEKQISHKKTNDKVLICDNGGFEDDFLHYEGLSSVYRIGSDDCNPKDSNNDDVIFLPSPLPAPRQFEIVGPGIDPLTGISQTKFGNKALKINDRYGHVAPQCNGNWGVDKIVKTFTVTEETRDFTVWYTVALENPSGHLDKQPFLNIKCDRAPQNELCFDADIVECEGSYSDANCTFQPIDVLDWACHRFKIPKEYVDSIATLEIVVADCARGGHFGFAYIDGICEECTGSSLGSILLNEEIDYLSCDGETAKICGTYTSPTICEQWVPDSIVVPGYDITNVVIDTTTKAFCFDFPIDNFSQEDCLEIYAEIYFGSKAFNLPPQSSNSIDICKSLYRSFNYFVRAGDCNSNDTDDNISDDYYYVEVDLFDIGDAAWTLSRILSDPYPNESGQHHLTSGQGKTLLNLGPFLIQEGNWTLVLEIDRCTYFIEIIAPEYCSGCSVFHEMDLDNVQCYDQGTSSINDDTWSFDLFVPGNPSRQYTISGLPGLYNFNTTYTIQVPAIGRTCREYRLQTIPAIPECTVDFIICPPKPCSDDRNCDLEIYQGEVECTEKNNSWEFNIDLDISSNGQYLCYESFAYSDPGNDGNQNYQIGNAQHGLSTFGPFTESVYLTFWVCDSPDCKDTKCEMPECFKTIYISLPDCDNRSKGRMKNLARPDYQSQDVYVMPNPVSTHMVNIESKLGELNFQLYNISGQLIKQGQLSKGTNQLNLPDEIGIYLFKYINSAGQPEVVKIIRI